MADAPVCHISTGSELIPQPKPTLLPSIGAAVDLPSAIAVINQLKLLVQMLAGQQSTGRPVVLRGFGGLGGAGPRGAAGAPGKDGKKGKDGKSGGRFNEDRSQRVTKKIRIYQNNDNTSPNWVDIKQINRCVWIDKVTGETIVWSRGAEGGDGGGED